MSTPVSVPQCNPAAALDTCSEQIHDAIQRVLESGHFILGQEVRNFEKKFAEYCETRHAIACANGTDAVELAVRALGLGNGDLVATVSHTATATVTGIRRAGATPLLLDISLQTGLLDPERFRAAAKHFQETDTPIRALVAVHLYGQPVDLPTILEIARNHDIQIVEDCAQAHGARLNNKPVGSWGDIGCFSFYPTKNLGAVGDAGACVTADTDLARNLSELRQYGWRERFVSLHEGMNSRMDELQAAILGVLIENLDHANFERARIAETYNAAIQESGTPLEVLGKSDNARHVFHQYVVKSSRRDSLAQHLNSAGIGSAIHYPVPVHQQPAYSNICVLDPLGLERTEKFVTQILSLPMFPQMTRQQVLDVCAALANWKPGL